MRKCRSIQSNGDLNILKAASKVTASFSEWFVEKKIRVEK